MDATATTTRQITGTVELYIDGVATGNAAKLRAAFHPEARMWGSLGGERYDVPIDEMIAMFDGHGADVDGSYRARIVSVYQTADTAMVTLAEEGFWGTVSFVDFFALCRFGANWKIVNKTFVHTGGQPPTH
jgi:hypothetical protein